MEHPNYTALIEMAQICCLRKGLIAKYAILFQEQGIHNIPVILPLLKQAACCDNNDAMYTVATILNNGIYSKADEIQVGLHLLANVVL